MQKKNNTQKSRDTVILNYTILYDAYTVHTAPGNNRNYCTYIYIRLCPFKYIRYHWTVFADTTWIPLITVQGVIRRY